MKLFLSHIALLILITLSGCEKKSPVELASPSVNAVAVEPLTPQKIQEMLIQATGELEKKNFGHAIEIVEKINRSDNKNVEAYLIEAQAHSMVGNFQSSIEALEKAFDRGFVSVARLNSETRFDGVRATAEFQNLLTKRGFSAAVDAKDKEIKAGNVSIEEDGNTQVIKAGDITLQIPKDQ